MIRLIHSYEECRDFVDSIEADPFFSDPMLANAEQRNSNLVKAIDLPERFCVFGVFREEKMVGLFSFLVMEVENYLEMLVGLSREQGVWEEAFRYLRSSFPGYDADFVFNPRNFLLREELEKAGADFDREQQKMVLLHPVPSVDTKEIELLSDRFMQQYFRLHNTDLYWTGEKVAEAPDRFRTFLAIHEDVVVGYLDVTCCFAENEPYDLLVMEEYRRKGYGRKLLARAVEMNRPSGMMALVEVDNFAAIRLYESVGFEKAENQNSLTAHWRIPEKRKTQNDPIFRGNGTGRG